MMNVLCDISILGMGFHDVRARTGVFRVAENVVQGLLESEQCHLDFCGSRQLGTIWQVKDYLLANKLSENARVVGPQGIGSRAYRDLWQRINQIGLQPRPSAVARLSRKLFYLLANGIERQTPRLRSSMLEPYDIFHSTYYGLPDAVRSSAKLKRFLTVYDLLPILHPQYFEAGSDRELRQTLAGLCEQDWVLCISEATKRDLCNHLPFLRPEQVVVTYLAVSQSFQPCADQAKIAAVKQKYGIPAAPYLLSLGTLEPRKNTAQVVRAFAHLVQQQKIADLNLVLVGVKGWDSRLIFETIATVDPDRTLQSRILFPGFVEEADLAPLYSGALAFVFMSLLEGFGLPPLEAMQCGVPVITSNTTSLPEVVGDAGLTLHPHDTDGLCQALLHLYQDADLRRERSQRSRQRAQQFSWQQCVEQTLAAYRAALSA